MPGIDVSAYQGPIQWAQVKAAGVRFGVARISDGTTAPDSQFARNWREMKAAGMLRGSYQYFRASEDAIAQANLVEASLNGAGGTLADDLPVVMDIETADHQSNTSVQAQMAAWLDAVARSTGRPPIIYTNPATSAVIGSGFGRYPLWVANWAAGCPTLPSGWSSWTLWQYASSGSVPGIAGMVDLDEFDGTLGDLLTFVVVGHADGGAADGGRPDGSADTRADAGAGADGSPMDAEPALGPDGGFGQQPDLGAAMGGGRVMGSTRLQPCSP